MYSKSRRPRAFDEVPRDPPRFEPGLRFIVLALAPGVPNPRRHGLPVVGFNSGADPRVRESLGGIVQLGQRGMLVV